MYPRCNWNPCKLERISSLGFMYIIMQWLLERFCSQCNTKQRGGYYSSVFAVSNSSVLKEYWQIQKWQTRKASKKAECNHSSHHITGLGRSSSPIPGISCISHGSVDSLLTLSSSHLRGGEQCSVPLMCNKVTSTQHLSRKKNQCISSLGPWHIRSSRKRAGNGIFKESNVLEENELLNPPSYCPIPKSKQFKSVFSTVTPLKIKWYAYFCCWKSLLLSGTRRHGYCQKLVTLDSSTYTDNLFRHPGKEWWKLN